MSVSIQRYQANHGNKNYSKFQTVSMFQELEKYSTNLNPINASVSIQRDQADHGTWNCSKFQAVSMFQGLGKYSTNLNPLHVCLNSKGPGRPWNLKSFKISSSFNVPRTWKIFN